MWKWDSVMHLLLSSLHILQDLWILTSTSNHGLGMESASNLFLMAHEAQIKCIFLNEAIYVAVVGIILAEGRIMHLSCKLL